MEGGGRTLVRAWAHLAVLWAFAVAQPVLQVLADSASFLVARGNAWPDLVLVTLGLVLVPPAVLVGVEAILPAPPSAGTCTWRSSVCWSPHSRFRC